MDIKKQYKKMKMIIKKNDKMIKRGQRALLEWKHFYTIEQYQNAVAYSFNPKINDLELFL